MKKMLLMISFFTRLPIGHHVTYSDDLYKKSLICFPMIGWLIGLALMPPFLLTTTTPLIRSLLVVMVYLWISGGIHLDGLADSVDGLFSNRDRSRILEIMRDPHIGSFGVIALILYFLTFVIAASELPPLALLFMPVVGKTLGFVCAGFSQYAREDAGMGYVFISEITKKQAIPYGLSLFVLMGLFYGLVGLAIVSIAMLSAFWMVRVCHVKIQGMTGDTIGMVIEISQLVYLVSFTVLI